MKTFSGHCLPRNYCYIWAWTSALVKTWHWTNFSARTNNSIGWACYRLKRTPISNKRMDLEQDLGPNLVKIYHGRGVWEIFWLTNWFCRKKFSKLKLMKSFLQIDYVTRNSKPINYIMNWKWDVIRIWIQSCIINFAFESREKYF